MTAAELAALQQALHGGRAAATAGPPAEAATPSA
jgi:hypothetical protein